MPGSHITGSYLDGKTSRRHEAYLESVGADSLRIIVAQTSDNGVTAGAEKVIALERSELRVESRLGNTPREMAFGTGELFITDDNDGVDELLRQWQSSGSVSVLHRFESSLPTIAVSVVLTLILIAATAVYGVPAAAKYIAYSLPDFASNKLGSSLDVMDSTVFEPSSISSSREQEIRALFAPHLEKFAALNPRVEFRSGMKANAFALPGGQIVFTDDFIKVVERDEELLAILYHELGHLKHRHITRRALQGSMITLLIVLITGDIDTVDILTGLPTLILDLSYSRDFEREADKFALEHLQAVGISPRNFALAMQHLERYYAKNDELSPNAPPEEEHPWIDFLSTHPPTQERIDLANQFQ